MRTFIALDLPPDFADDAAALARRLSASMEGRFLKRDTYHLTLAFLGDVDEAQLAAATDALEAACASPGSVFKTIRFIAVSQDMTPSRKILRSLSLCSGELAWLGTL